MCPNKNTNVQCYECFVAHRAILTVFPHWTSKIKVHLLTHVTEHIKSFGPLPNVSTEVFFGLLKSLRVIITLFVEIRSCEFSFKRHYPTIEQD